MHEPLHEIIKELARDFGFDACVILPDAPSTRPSRAPLEPWLAERRHGIMEYLEGPTSRTDPGDILPEVRTSIILAKNYKLPLDLLPAGLRIARYAHGEDYHDLLRARLAKLAAALEARADVTVTSRAITDSAPMLERQLARRAGLGWIGKNTMLIDQSLGSFFLLAELLIDVALDDHIPEAPAPDRCGRCTRCLDACPTQAIAAPHLLDARRCISYLTIELKGPIPRHLRPLIGDYLFGCDICQDVCPWNSRAPLSADPDMTTREDYLTLSPADLLTLTRRQFNALFKGSPIQRTRRQGLLRNAAVVIGNGQDTAHTELLATRLAIELEPLVRGHIAWALSRMDDDASLLALERAWRVEPDEYVREELLAAIETHPRQTRDSPLM